MECRFYLVFFLTRVKMRVAGSKCFNHSYNDEPQTVIVFIKEEEFVLLGGLYVKPAQNGKLSKLTSCVTLTG